MTNPAPDPASLGGAGGGVAPFRNMELSRGVRERRLARMVARARLSLARETAEVAGADTKAALQALREGLAAKVVLVKDGVSVDSPDPRERRQSAEALLHHHREVAKGLASDQPAQGSLNAPPVLVIAPEDLERAWMTVTVRDDMRSALWALAAPAPAKSPPGSAEGQA